MKHRDFFKTTGLLAAGAATAGMSGCAFLSRTDLGQFRDPFRLVFGELVAALIVKYTKQARRRKIYAKRRRRK